MRAVALILACLLLATAARADECTGGDAGSLSVIATPLNFADYVAISGMADETSFTLTAECSGGLGTPVLPPFNVSLSPGNGSYTQRHMTKAADVLNYQIFSDAGMTTIWGDGSGGTSTVGSAGGAASQDFQGYGAIPAGQWVSPGSYEDVITVTVSY
jgi:spore coat protein U-like protein